MPYPQLVEARNKYSAKLTEQSEFWKSIKDANGVPDPAKAGMDSNALQIKVANLGKELDDLNAEVQKWANIEESDLKARLAQAESGQKGDGHNHGSDKKDEGEGERKLFVLGSGMAKKFAEARAKHGLMKFDLDVFPSQIRQLGMKTLFETGAGWAPESLRLPGYVPAATRPLQILDLIPTFPTSYAAVPWMLETTRTPGAAARSEGAAYGEAAFALTAQTATVRSIADSIPVTDEQIEDVQMVEGYLSSNLMFGVRQKLDEYCFNGDGTPPRFYGISTTSGINTQAQGADNPFDAVFKGLTAARVTGRSNPDAVVLHSTDWQIIRLWKDSNGNYLFGPPSMAGANTLWGLPVALCEAGSAGTGLVGDFARYSALFERKGVTMEIGYVNAQFTEGEKTMRADMRAVLIVKRPTAFTKITGITAS